MITIANNSVAASYDYFQGTLALLLAISASYVLLDVAGRAFAAHAETRLAWIAGGAASTGMGFWAVHRVAMFAFSFPVPASYHWPTSLGSLSASVLFSAFALYAMSRPRMGSLQVVVNSVVMGGGIAIVHYSALAALRLAADRQFDPLLVAVSIGLGILCSLITLRVALSLRRQRRGNAVRKAASALVAGTIVLAVHFSAMAAVSFTPSYAPPDLSHTVSAKAVGRIGTGIALFGLVFLGLTVLASESVRVLARQAETLEERVAERTAQLRSANEKLEKSEAEAKARADELASVLDAVPGMVFISREPDSRTIVGNRLMYESLQMPYGTNVSKSTPDGQRLNTVRVTRFGRELPADELPIQLAAATGQEVREAEFTWVYEDGTSRDTFGNAVPLRDSTGKVRGAVGVFVDITARNRAQAALRESEDRYRDLVENSQDLLCTHDLSGNLLSCNPAPAHILGYEVNELLNIPMRELTAPEYREQFDAYLARISKNGADKGLTIVVTRTGERRIWEYSNTLRTAGVASPIVRGMAHDLTERMRTEKSLELFRLLVDQSNDSIEVVDPETFRFIDINGTACKGMGYTREELLSMTVYDIDPTLNESMRAQLLERLRTSGSSVFESRHRRKDGSTFPVEVSVNQIRLDRDYLVAVARDITEREGSERALRELRTELARIARFATMGELRTSIAHEINQPLAAVITDSSAALHWLALPSPDLSQARAAIGRAIQEANRASHVIEGIRGLLQKAPRRQAPLNGNEIIEETLRLAEPEIQRTKAIVRTELAPDAPIVLGDRLQLEQVVLNLILNALEAMSIGDRQELLIRSSQHPDGLLIQVIDSGGGIEAENVDRIFEPFFTTKPGGIGVGLSISRSIVRAHGGRLWAENQPSHGAIFQFTLPVAGGE